VAKTSLAGARSGRTLRPALVNGSPGAVLFERDQAFAIMGYTVVHGRITEIDVIRDPDRLGRLDLTSMLT
jgi:RNA polymerase sigma-70 factor (ECF subfamily)